MSSARSVTFSILAAGAVAVLGYGVYFDYQRRNSKEFRRQLRKTAKKHEKDQEAAAEAGKNELKAKIQKVLEESFEKNPIPESLQERERMFAEEVAKGDELLNAPGEDAKLMSALGFYRALYVYPSPIDLLNIYDEKLSQSVLQILQQMIILQPPPQLIQGLGRAAGAAGATGSSAAAAAAAAAEAPMAAEDVE